MIEIFIVTFTITILTISLIKWLQIPSRTYHTSSSVSSAYDVWTTQGVLEHYWGEHVHLGYYDSCVWFQPSDSFFSTFFRALLSPSSSSAAFKTAKHFFTEKMIAFARLSSAESESKKILDVGCGIGGSTRILAKKFPNSQVLGISISPEQIARARQLTEEAGINNAQFEVMDAMNISTSQTIVTSQTYNADKVNTGDKAEEVGEKEKYDIIYVCESSEHMPDKVRFFRGCYDVLKKGGTMVVAAWCCREGRGRTAEEEKELRYLEEEWSHPMFASMEEISNILAVDLKAKEFQVADWTKETLPSWRHSVLVGIWNPWPVIVRPWVWLSTVREIYTLEKMHRAFKHGLMHYGLFRLKK